MISDERRVINTTKYNKTVHFLLPMLGLQGGYYSNLMNCYISDKNRPDIDNYHLFLLYKYKDDKIRGIEGFKTEYTTDEGQMYVFRIAKEFEQDYLLFILGKYSEFSETYKKQIIRLLPKPTKEQNVFKVITKAPEAKAIIEEKVGQSIGEQEVMSVPDMEQEMYG